MSEDRIEVVFLRTTVLQVEGSHFFFTKQGGWSGRGILNRFGRLGRRSHLLPLRVVLLHVLVVVLLVLLGIHCLVVVLIRLLVIIYRSGLGVLFNCLVLEEGLHWVWHSIVKRVADISAGL